MEPEPPSTCPSRTDCCPRTITGLAISRHKANGGPSWGRHFATTKNPWVPSGAQGFQILEMAAYTGAFVFGKPRPRSPSFHLPAAFITSMRSKRFNTLRRVATLLADFKLRCIDMGHSPFQPVHFQINKTRTCTIFRIIVNSSIPFFIFSFMGNVLSNSQDLHRITRNASDKREAFNP